MTRSESGGPRGYLIVDGKRPLLFLSAALTVVLAAYSGVIAGPFVWDDVVLIAGEPSVHEIRPLSEYFGAGFWRASANGPQLAYYYRPLVALTYALDWKAWGGDAAGFHATNLALHLVVVSLVFGLARKLGASAPWAAIGACLFGVFPRLTESVSWISGRTDVLAAIGCFSALLLFRPGPAGLGFRVLSGAFLFFGLLAKEVAAVAFPAIAVWAWATHASPGRVRRTGLDLLPATAAVGAYLGLRWSALSGSPGASFDLPVWSRVWLPLQAVGRYAAMVAWPFEPRFGMGVLPLVEPAFVALGVAVMLLSAWIAWKTLGRASPPLLAVLTAGLAALALVVHLIPLRVHSVALDRFLYVPVACAAAVAASAASRRLGERASGRLALAMLVPITLFAWSTAQRNRDWRDEVGLWAREAARASSLDGVVLSEYGNALFRAGRPFDALRQHEAALERFGKLSAATGRPFTSEKRTARTNISSSLSELGRYPEARIVLDALLEEEPGVAVNWYNRGILLARSYDFVGARNSLLRAIELYPDYAQARQALSLVEELRREGLRLPPETDQEPAELVARRARMATRAGRWQDAQRLWTRVAGDPASTAEDLRPALVFFIDRGELELADRTYSRLSSSLSAADRAAAAAAIAERRRLSSSSSR